MEDQKQSLDSLAEMIIAASMKAASENDRRCHCLAAAQTVVLEPVGAMSALEERNQLAGKIQVQREQQLNE